MNLKYRYPYKPRGIVFWLVDEQDNNTALTTPLPNDGSSELVNTSVPQSAEESNWQIVTNSIFHVTTVSLVKCNVAFFYCYI